MMRHAFTWGAFVAGGLLIAAPLAGQQRSSERSYEQSQDRSEQRSEESSQRGDDSDAGVRVRYDDESDRFSLDVSGVGQNLHQWWQSWWEDEQRSGRSVGEGADLGARAFLRQHDTDDDGYLSRREMPEGARDEFGRVDRNDDNFLSRSEVRQYGEELYGTQRGGSEQYSTSRQSSDQRDNYDRESSRTASRQDDMQRQSNREDQSWSEWWSSWWSDDQSSQNRERRGADGARQFVRQHDGNDDGYISRREMPQRMRDEFARLDRNGDDYLSSSEVRQGGLAQSSRQSATARRTSEADDYRRDDYRTSDQRRSQTADAEQSWSDWWASWWSNDFDSEQQHSRSGADRWITQHDDDNDGYLSRQEFPSRLRTDFARIDRNGDDYLSRSEIERNGSSLRSSSTEARSASLSRRGQSGSQSSSQRSSRQARKTPVEVAYVWVIDANQGTVQLEDLQQAYQVLFEMDSNSDGRLSRSELREQHQQAVEQWCEQCFTKLDEDGDNRLSREEAQASVFANRFDNLDNNSDGELTQDEIRRSMQEQFEARTESSDEETRR